MILGKKQKNLLKAIIDTNGGGYTVPPVDAARAYRLYNLGLIQWCSGNVFKFVHTVRGLEHYRNLRDRRYSSGMRQEA